MRSTAQPKEKSNLTISVDGNSIEKIKELAKSQGISLNAMVNDIIERHVYFYRITEEMECSIIPRNVWQSMLELIDEDDFKKILSGEGIASIYSIFVNGNIPLTLENLITQLCEKVGIWCGMYSSFLYIRGSDSLTLIFEHNRGLKWSKILENAFVNVIHVMLSLQAKSETTPNYMKIKIAV